MHLHHQRVVPAVIFDYKDPPPNGPAMGVHGVVGPEPFRAFRGGGRISRAAKQTTNRYMP